MTMRVAVQMDPIETINIGGDSSFALLLEAQARGATLIHYLAGDLSAENGRVRAKARPLKVKNEAGAHYEWLGDRRTVDLADEADVVLMRQDPPFDMGYITATHLLEQIQDRVLVVNDPAEVRNAPEKLFVLRFPDLMPPTLVTKSLEEAMDFRARHGAIVVKPLYGNAGTAVFLIDKTDGNLPALVELFGSVWREPFMVQAWPKATSASCWSMVNRLAPSTACQRRAKSAPTSPPVAAPSPPNSRQGNRKSARGWARN